MSRTNSSAQVCAPPVAKPVHSVWIILECKNGRKRVVQKLVACGFNVPPDELQNREWFWLSRWTVLKAEEQEGQAGVEKRGSRLFISHSAGAAQLRRQLRQFDCS